MTKAVDHLHKLSTMQGALELGITKTIERVKLAINPEVVLNDDQCKFVSLTFQAIFNNAEELWDIRALAIATFINSCKS